MKRIVLLAGGSACGKSTLSKALAANDSRYIVSTSAYLRAMSGLSTDRLLAEYGRKLDQDNPQWLQRLIELDLRQTACVVDAVRSDVQDNSFGAEAIRINVIADHDEVRRRASTRGRDASQEQPFLFRRPDFTWDSSRVSLATAVAVINQLSGFGVVDAIVGGQYGSEGKGKLAALLASRYDVLVRTGGPNAGHWVRDEHYEFCFHHIPSGALANPQANIAIAAGATLGVGFLDEVRRTGVANRLWIDPNAMVIEDGDVQAESKLVDIIGSTAQGVGACTARRVLRGLRDSVETAADHEDLRHYTTGGAVSRRLAKALASGSCAMLEGTQGSALSLFHGPYPYTTSRDTNVGGLLAEIGVPPSSVRDVWMVVRSMPIRVGGNSGPMKDERDWEDVAARTGRDPVLLKSRELTSTTRRQRRVAEFDWDQFGQAVTLNRPSKLFLTFADYVNPKAEGVTSWGALPDEVHQLVGRLEDESGALVAGVSTGRTQAEVCWRS